MAGPDGGGVRSAVAALRARSHRAWGWATAGPAETGGPSADLPRSPGTLPPRVVDGLVVAVIACLFAGFLASQVVVHGPHNHPRLGPPVWTAHTIVGAACFPVVFTLWWRRRHPVAVLGSALAVLVIGYPFPVPVAAVALYSAAARLVPRLAIRAGIAAAACIMAGRVLFDRAGLLSDATSALAFAGLATALGMYLGARRAYLDRLRERALFARALASFLPPEVADLVQESPAALSLEQEAEATVLFSDIRGFSTLAESLTPRQAAQVVRRHIAAMAEVVHNHGGMLDKFAGDAVMAVFGVPRPMDGHAQRALDCAVTMQRRQALLNGEAAGLDLPATQIGVGVNTGPLIAGTIGGPGRVDYTVLGDAVNIAQRLQAAAPAGEIYVSAATLEQVTAGGAEPVGSRQLKGRTAELSVYRIPWDPHPSPRSVPEPDSTPRHMQREDTESRR